MSYGAFLASRRGGSEWEDVAERIKKAIEDLEPAHGEKDPEVSNWYFDGWYEAKEAALDAIEEIMK